MTDDLRTQKLKWFVETGYVDGGGIGYWDGTKESIEVESQSAAYALRDEWLDKGKLIKTHWGELRPTFSYGTFRIRSIWVDVPNPLTNRIEALTAKLTTCEEIGRAFEKDAGQLRDKLAKAVEALRKLHHAVCGETGFAACVRLDSGLAYPWPALDEADEITRAVLAEVEGEKG